ncbi:hypothetical protein IHE45_02G035400 [Dioscorea alata]|uniref:Uncharacterized protein n=1 Tax=Dioscorea alata TaxID=55571 RepID=A0ACB7WNY6_DIOAL|nr:hypothetical protein IHE45_02G035400 [Dioscorea alata]
MEKLSWRPRKSTEQRKAHSARRGWRGTARGDAVRHKARGAMVRCAGREARAARAARLRGARGAGGAAARCAKRGGAVREARTRGARAARLHGARGADARFGGGAAARCARRGRRGCTVREARGRRGYTGREARGGGPTATGDGRRAAGTNNGVKEKKKKFRFRLSETSLIPC